MKKYLALALSSVMLLSQAGGLSVHASESDLVSMPVDMSDVYNITQIYSDTAPTSGYKVAGAEGTGKSWYYLSDFKNSATVGWKEDTTWENGNDVNTLESAGVDFNLKVSQSENVAYAGKNYQANWVDIDVDDYKYSEMHFLMTFANSTQHFANLELRLNYDDGSWTYDELIPMKMGNKTPDTSKGETTPVASIALAGESNKTAVQDPKDTMYIHHYKINTDPAKVLENISVLSVNYNYDKDANGELQYEADGMTAKLKFSNGGTGISSDAATNCPIYAITGMVTPEEYERLQEEERKNQPVSKPVDLSEYYNITGIWGVGTETSAGKAAPDDGSFNGKEADEKKGRNRYWVNESKESSAAGWITPWSEVNGAYNTLVSEGVEFQLKVVAGDNENTAFFNKDYVSDASATGEALWSTVELDDYKYTSIDLLQACTASSSGYYKTQGIRLNYDDGTYQYYQHNVALAEKSTDSNAKRSVELQGYIKKNTDGDNGKSLPKASPTYMHHYTLQADSGKVLESISVLSINYDFDTTSFTNGQTTAPTSFTRHGLSNDATLGVAIYAITGVTTVGEVEANEPAFTIENAEKTYNDDANTITVTGTVKKISSKTSCAYLALYVDGRLQEVKDITSVTNLNCTFQNVSKDGEVKYFVWESVSNMKPYFAAVTVNEAL